jgi:hypothetical protein
MCHQCYAKFMYNKHRQKILAAVRKYAETNRSKVKQAIRAVRLRNAEYIIAYKILHPCIDCGEADPRCLDFDHKPGEIKSANVCQMKQFSLEKVDEEIAKCDVRCANCHRKKTHERKQCLTVPLSYQRS